MALHKIEGLPYLKEPNTDITYFTYYDDGDQWVFTDALPEEKLSDVTSSISVDKAIADNPTQAALAFLAMLQFGGEMFEKGELEGRNRLRDDLNKLMQQEDPS